MRLRKTENHLLKLGIKYTYMERKGLGRIYIGNVLIKEHYVSKTRVNIYAEEINLVDETQLIGWVNHNEDRFR